LKEAKTLYFTGTEDSMEPIRSLHAVGDETMKIIGHLMAASICNYGPAPNFLSPWVFNYIIGGISKVLEDLPASLHFTNNDENYQICEVYNKVRKFRIDFQF